MWFNFDFYLSMFSPTAFNVHTKSNDENQEQSRKTEGDGVISIGAILKVIDDIKRLQSYIFLRLQSFNIFNDKIQILKIHDERILGFFDWDIIRDIKRR